MGTQIFIAEDEKIIVKDIENTLKRLGYSIAGSAGKAEQVIKKAEDLKPDLILMDIMLDNSSGIEAANVILENHDIPVIYLTALADESTLQKAKVTEAYGYVLKPFDDKTLRSAVEMALYKHKMNLKLKERTRELEEEKLRSDSLLHNIFPADMVFELKESGAIKPREYESVTLLFTDFKGFTRIAAQMPPNELVTELNEIFRSFDLIVEKYELEKLKTIGDSYMAGCGFPKQCGDHAVRVISAAMEMNNYIKTRNLDAKHKWKMRLGVHSGKVVAGVVGKNKFSYDVWGDTVNIANRMERFGETGKINVSSATFDLIKEKFNCEYAGDAEFSANGKINMYHIIENEEVKINNL